ncbi:MAG: ATP-binding protein [Chloroflexota bacterium]
MTATAGDRRGRASLLAAIALAAGTGFALFAEVQQLDHDNRPPAWLVGDFVGGWTFLLTGAIAWARRPENRIGPLMLAIGFTWFIGTYGLSDIDWVSHLARSLQGFYEPLLGVLVLAYPSGRLGGLLERVVAGGWFLEHASWSVARVILDRPLSWYGCPTCPATADAFIADRQLLESIAPISLALSVALAVVVIVVAGRRLLAAGPAGRRRLAPTALASVALGLGIATTGWVRLAIAPALFSDFRIVALTYVTLTFAAVAVLAGLLQDRLARTAVADLVIDLRREAGVGEPDPRRLRDALARALGDPSMELYLADTSTATYRGLDGALATLPAASSRRALTFIGNEGNRIAAIVHDPSLLDDPGLIAAVTAAVRLEADNRQLAGEVERQLAELRASRARIVRATDVERRRVERDLHDGAQQRLVTLSMELGRVRTAAGQSGDRALRDALTGLSTELEAAIEVLGELARGILPPILTDAGLGPAVESLALRASLPVDAEVALPDRLPAAIESTLYFVIAEGLANVTRYAHATRATIRVGRRDGAAWVEVQDDGIGGADARRGSGLQGLNDRVGALGGTLQVESVPGRGTHLRAELPVPS